MYEGKNIHFSPLDNKPLCSYSAKVCKQRRLNGYSLCLRHVLEDPGAPFRQCLYQARNKQQCTNPIHKNNDAQFCTSHLQLLGLIPVGAKSCSKSSREGKLVKNGLHSLSQKDQQRNKTKSLDNSGSVPETQSTPSDPYVFRDVDSPKTSKSSPPLLSMVDDVSGMPGCITAISGGSTRTSVQSEPNKSIPISRLYPELVEKLESDRIRSQPRPKTGNGMRTVPSLQNKNPQNRIKLKKCSSPSTCAMTSDSNESIRVPSSLSTLMNPPAVSSTTSSDLLTSVASSPNTKLDLTESGMAVSGSSSDTKNPAIISHNPWMLPMFRPVMPQQGMPVMHTLSKAFHGLLNPLPLLKGPTQPHFTAGSFLQSSVNQNPLLRSQSEPQRSSDKTLSLRQTPSATPPAVSQCLASLDLKTAGSLTTRMQTNHTNLAVPEITSAASNTPTSAAAAATETNRTLKTTMSNSNFEDSHIDNSSKMIHYVQPRSRSFRFSEKEARRRIRRKVALKIYLEHAARVMENSNLLPTGVDSSNDDDDDDDLDHELPWQRLWNDLSSDEGEGDFDLAEDVASNIRRTKLQLLKSKMRRQFTQLQRCHEGNSSVRWRHRMSMDYLIASCRQDTEATVEALRLMRNMKPSDSSSCRSNEGHRQRKRPCLHRSESDIACTSVALPYTNHCLRHIMYNVDQMLFGYCTAKFADKTQCCVPVFDVKHELPLCPDHVIKDVTQENHEIKPKKQRKKTKPSALTRPPKKGKKKKCQRKTIQKPQKPLGILESRTNCTANGVLGDSVQELAVLSSTSSISSSAQVFCLASSTATGSCALLSTETLSKDSMDDDALGSDLDVTFSPTGLPLDHDQSTNFLDDHELHEMLNKMADEAFDLSSGKNGGYVSSKDVEEEFVRALVEVTKTFSETKQTQLEHLSQDHGLVTLLPDSTNEDELTKQIADSLLNRNSLSPSGSVSDDQDNLNDLASSLTVHDLKSISQVMESSIISQALELCPSAISMSSALSQSDGHSLPHDNGAINYLNGSDLLQQLSHEQTLGTTVGFPPVGSQSHLTIADSNIRTPGIINFPLTSNGMLESATSSHHTVAPASMPPRLPSVLSSMLPLSLGVSNSRVSHTASGIASQPLLPSRSGNDCFAQSYQSLPDIQTLMKQPWRIGDSSAVTEFRRNSVTLSTASVPVNFPSSQFSYIPGFHPQFLVSESKVACPVLPKGPEPSGIQSVIAALPVTNSADLYSSNNALSSLHKI